MHPASLTDREQISDIFDIENDFFIKGNLASLNESFLLNDFFLLLNMRIDQHEIATIKCLAEEHFGSGTKVYLFGSRVDDDKKGGDIDLFITNKNRTKLTLDSKIDFLTDLKSIIGNQKIDVVLDNSLARRKKQFYQSVTKKYVEI